MNDGLGDAPHPPLAPQEGREGIVLELREVRKSFCKGGKAIEVLKGVSCQVRAGEKVAIVGPSGSGKSTLLHIGGALLTPTSGEVIWGGRSLLRCGDAELSRWRNEWIGFVFQFHHLHPELTALENTLIPMKISGRGTAPVQEAQGRRWLAVMGLQDRADHLPGELSGGEQQRVAIARALVMNPRLIMADEPTGDLDRSSGEKVFQALQEACDLLGSALVVVTHDPEIGSRCDRVWKIVDGRLQGP